MEAAGAEGADQEVGEEWGLGLRQVWECPWGEQRAKGWAPSSWFRVRPDCLGQQWPQARGKKEGQGRGDRE